MLTDADMAFGRQRMNEVFGSREAHLLWSLVHYTKTLQKFDATFYRHEPILDVSLDRNFAAKLNMRYGERFSKLTRLLRRITFSDGTVVPLEEIWTLNYMPTDGISIAELDGVDMSEAEVKAGNQGETIREMLRATYRCNSAAEEDYFVRRFLAS